MHKNIDEDRACSSEDMIADRQNTQTRSSEYSAPLWGGGGIKKKLMITMFTRSSATTARRISQNLVN